MLWIVVVLIVFIIVYLYSTWTCGFWKKKDIPYVVGFPYLGTNFMSTLKLRPPTLDSQLIYQKYPDEQVCGMFLLSTPTMMIKDPELIKKVNIKDFESFLDHPRLFITEGTDSLFAKNLFSLNGKKWKQMRSTLSPAFTSSKMKMMFELVSDCGEQNSTFLMEQCFKEGKPTTLDVELKDLSTRFANDVIATCAFGIKCDSLKNTDNEFYQMGKRLTAFNTIRLTLVGLFPKIMKLFKQGVIENGALNYFTNIILETLDMRKKYSIIRPDVVHLLMEAQKGTLAHEDESNKANEAGYAAFKESEVDLEKTNKLNLTDEDVVAQALIFFVAGFDTSSNLLAFMGHELAINEDIQRKLQEEIDESLKRNSGKISYDALFRMEYLDMFISECLRKWPPVVQTDRVCTKNYMLETEKRKILIEKGTIIVLPVYAIHHDSKYFPNPDKFDPERFSYENKHKIHQSTYFPFGLGPRGCIGSRFALMEAKILYFHLLSKFDFVVTKKTNIKSTLANHPFRLSLKNGFWVGLKPRKNKPE